MLQRRLVEGPKDLSVLMAMRRYIALDARKIGIRAMDKWAVPRTAYQVAKLGTLGAADALGFHRATLNRYADMLEPELGGRLILRNARG